MLAERFKRQTSCLISLFEKIVLIKPQEWLDNGIGTVSTISLEMKASHKHTSNVSE